MALQISLPDTDTVGVAAPAAYARLVYYTHDVKANTITCSIEFHYNKAARTAGLNPIKGASFLTDEATINTFTGGMQARIYSYLKTLPEFAGALDV